MGKLSILTPEQKAVLKLVATDEFLNSHFYFTGGTALSTVYLQHRHSEDLDFFSEQQFEPHVVFQKMQDFAGGNRAKVTLRSAEVVHIFDLDFGKGKKLKVDFAHYPYRRLEESVNFQGVKTDSIADIATNKLLTISQRTEVKDFVDLYFLLQKLTVWDLMHGVRIKFRVKVEPFILASDLLKVEEFDFLPKMIKPLTINQLQDFFKDEAKSLGGQAVE